MIQKRYLVVGICLFSAACSTVRPNVDHFMWLEDSNSPETKKWVEDHNNKSKKELMGDPTYAQLEKEIRPIVTAKDRIPYPMIRNGKIQNFWQDENHVRGIWRETTFSDYENPNPHWKVILDIDELNKKEKKSWVYAGKSCLPPADNDCLLQLSNGGGDKVVVREFDVSKKEFVTGGFELPEGKTQAAWVDKDTLLVGTDFGTGTVTSSGYPRQIRIWKRGTDPKTAPIVFEGKVTDVSVKGFRSFRPESKNIFFQEDPSFYESKVFLYSKSKIGPIDFPITSEFLGDFKGEVLARLRQDWKVGDKTIPSGSVVSMPLKKHSEEPKILFSPDGHTAFSEIAFTKNSIFLSILRDVKSELYKVTKNFGHWKLKKLPFPGEGTVGIVEANPFDEHLFVTYGNFTTPLSLYMDLKKIKEVSPKFNADDIVFEQYFSTSKDGTKVPYFLVHKKSMVYNGQNPTLLYGYGGFEIPLTPIYSGVTGKIWLEKGGVFVLSNIRGGGEYGPQWHEAALKENRQRAYDDFASVAEDLFSKKITSPEKLGIQGGSNGGLLVGAVLTQHPDYYKAVICESALLDMIRYTKLPPGASWIGEYGDPDDPRMAEIISRYSPYQNIKPGVKYPKVFFHISTADDRVQPGHTRKTVALMEEYGNDVLVYENTEGGHGGSADLEQRIRMLSLEETYLYQQLMK